MRTAARAEGVGATGGREAGAAAEGRWARELWWGRALLEFGVCGRVFRGRSG
jgi:hypothetical protein